MKINGSSSAKDVRELGTAQNENINGGIDMHRRTLCISFLYTSEFGAGYV
jgi:hypothetical protein